MPLNPPFGPNRRGYQKEDWRPDRRGYQKEDLREQRGQSIWSSKPRVVSKSGKELASGSLRSKYIGVPKANPKSGITQAEASALVSQADAQARAAKSLVSDTHSSGALGAFIGSLSPTETNILRHLSTEPILPLQLASDNLLLPQEVMNGINHLSEKGLVEFVESQGIDLVWQGLDEHAVRLSSVGLVAKQALPSI